MPPTHCRLPTEACWRDPHSRRSRFIAGRESRPRPGERPPPLAPGQQIPCDILGGPGTPGQDELLPPAGHWSTLRISRDRGGGAPAMMLKAPLVSLAGVRPLLGVMKIGLREPRKGVHHARAFQVRNIGSG